MNTDYKSTGKCVAREYSKRLGILSLDQFQAALDRFDLGRLICAEPISFGNFGQNVFLTTTKGEYVLRGAPHYPWQFPKEQFFAQLLHERTSVPVPWPYLLDLDDAIFGWNYVIMPWMPGLHLADPKVRANLTIQDKHGIASAMGKTLADLQCLTWDSPGEYDLKTNTIKPLTLHYREWIVSRIRHYLQRSVPLSDRTTDDDVMWVEDLIAQKQDALDVSFQPCFVMQDFKVGNTVVECRDGVWQISGLFDFMEPYFGDGEADLSRQVAVYTEQDQELARTFVFSYLKQMRMSNKSLRPGFAKRFVLYMLLDRLIIWEFAQRRGVWWDARLTLREWATPYISLTVP